MKKNYLSPTARVIRCRLAPQLLQHHSVRAFQQTQARYVGDTDEDYEIDSDSHNARFIGDFDEE